MTCLSKRASDSEPGYREVQSSTSQAGTHLEMIPSNASRPRAKAIFSPDIVAVEAIPCLRWHVQLP